MARDRAYQSIFLLVSSVSPGSEGEVEYVGDDGSEHERPRQKHDPDSVRGDHQEQVDGQGVRGQGEVQPHGREVTGLADVRTPPEDRENGITYKTSMGQIFRASIRKDTKLLKDQREYWVDLLLIQTRSKPWADL